MIRSSRLMATMLAAVFAAVLAAPAYATYTSTCGSASARHTTTSCKAEGTKFDDLDADGKRDSGEPGLANWRIWADFDNDGVLDSGEPYDDTDANGRYVIDGIKPTSSSKARTYTTPKTYRLREKRPGGGTDGWTCSYPNASTSGGFANGTGGDFKCGHGPIDVSKDPKVTGKDFGNYKKPKITVIKKLVPATDSGRFDLKVDGATIKAAAGDGGSGSTFVTVGAHQVTETGANGTNLADYTASIDCKTTTAARTYGPDWVHVKSGDDVTCTITNTRKGKVEIVKQTEPAETGGTSFGFTGFAGAFSLTHGGMKTITGVLPRTDPYTVTESNAAGYKLKSITCNDGDSTGAVGTRTASIRVAAGETVRCTFVNSKLAPAIEVVKSGPAQVHHGDKMDFSFAVRNVGNTPLHDIKVTDDRCAPVSAAPVSKTGGDQDDLLEDAEVWTYTCTKTVPAHGAGEADPLCNVATATGHDEQEKPVTDTDQHCTDIVHPAINVKKTPNRTTATVGDTIGYRFDVTNPGDIGLAVTLSDPRCDAGTIAGPQKVTGDSDNSLEPGELWRYTCTHKVTASDPDPLPNTVHVTGKDPLGGTGGTVEDEDSATVDLTQPAPPKQDVKPAPQQQVLAAQEQSQARGRARLRGPSGCVYRTFRANVTGRQIRRVTFFVDGRRVAIRRARNGQRTFTARVTPGRLSIGVHRVTARVVFRTASRTRARTLVLSFQHCARLATSPRFTG
jgi:Prealbumin-like fold domain